MPIVTRRRRSLHLRESCNPEGYDSASAQRNQRISRTSKLNGSGWNGLHGSNAETRQANRPKAREAIMPHPLEVMLLYVRVVSREQIFGMLNA
jgi:hypothetical protein